MKTILILSDTLNRHFLPAYGNNWVKTPNIDRLAKKSVTFDNHWAGSMPCMPARRDLLTGRLNFLEKPWGGMEPFDKSLTDLMRKNGVYSHMITDHYHYFHPGGENYQSGFSSWKFIRGQEMDVCSQNIKGEERPKRIGRWNPVYGKNRATYEKEEEYPTTKTFQAGIDWLDKNKNEDNYFLWLEVFDPHEPFDVPDEYLEMYEDDWDGAVYNWPRYAFLDPEKGETPEAVRHLRKRYAASLTMMDKQLGKLLDKLEENNNFDDTMIILTTDHGFMLGEHNCTGKNDFHVWNEQAHLPLFVKMPGNIHAGEHRNQLTQNIDLFPTLCDYYNLSFEHKINGESWKPVLENNTPAKRAAAIYGYYAKAVNITDGEYTYFRSPNPTNQPLNAYFLSTVGNSHHDLMSKKVYENSEYGPYLSYTDYPVIKTPFQDGKLWYECGHFQETSLFNIEKDYEQKENLANTDIEKKYVDLLVSTMKKLEVPEENFERLNLIK
jgi:arylsulfatase A-like enzyme